MPHLESKTKLIMTASVNKYINPQIRDKNNNSKQHNPTTQRRETTQPCGKGIKKRLPNDSR